MSSCNGYDLLLEVNNLAVHYQTSENFLPALNKISFSMNSGDNLGILGESGSGKTTLAMALMGLIDPPHRVYGSVRVAGKELMALAG